MILTDEEMMEATGSVGMQGGYPVYMTFAELMQDYRAIEQAILERIGKPVGHYLGESDQGDDCIYLYGDEKLRALTQLYAIPEVK